MIVFRSNQGGPTSYFFSSSFTIHYTTFTRFVKLVTIYLFLAAAIELEASTDQTLPWQNEFSIIKAPTTCDTRHQMLLGKKKGASKGLINMIYQKHFQYMNHGLFEQEIKIDENLKGIDNVRSIFRLLVRYRQYIGATFEYMSYEQLTFCTSQIAIAFSHINHEYQQGGMYVHTSSIQIGNVIANDKDYSNEQCHIVKFCNEKK